MAIPETASGFAAGSLVHTREGLRPIEEIKVGDWVLSRHESGEGEQAYKRVTRTIQSEDVPIGFMRYFSDTQVEHVRVTSNHPFYVKGAGWIQAGDASHPLELDSYDGTPLGAWDWGSLWGTGTEGVAIVFSHQTDCGTVIDFRDGVGVVVDELGHQGMSDGTAWCETVYNIEVEEFHTCFVGELGVWVHSLNSGGAAGTGTASK